ncbi:hypothetical protein ABT294_41605 [Nonomuraea sp. NPDC000554]|uniref:hypothetical protein n=1 Tax=Nonomuraea sp. NPDC000554 TaxID=3154259 RepID=UPI0033290334
MAGLDLQFQALGDGQTIARELSKDYYEAAGGYPAAAADSLMFGKLDSASALATLLDRVEDITNDDLEYAHRRLAGVKAGLEEVEINVRKANKASEVGAA